MTKQIDILVVELGQAPQVTQTESTLETFEQIIGAPVDVGLLSAPAGNARLPGERKT